MLFTLAGSAAGQTVKPTKPSAQPKKTVRRAKVQARKARVRAILAAPTTPDTATGVRPRRPVPVAKPGQRPGSAP
ncbi:MAG TPA: hypothetical protein VF690_06180, partial [Hymenobacter sp.]